MLSLTGAKKGNYTREYGLWALQNGKFLINNVLLR